MSTAPTSEMPVDLMAAIATEPLWLQIWVGLLGLANLGALLFVLVKQDDKWRPRKETLAILASFMLAGAFMEWLYHQVGYVRLLGLPHLVFWTPVYAWLLLRYRKGDFSGLFKHYLLFYLIIAGISLVIDSVDVIRYLLGDHTPLHL